LRVALEESIDLVTCGWRNRSAMQAIADTPSPSLGGSDAAGVCRLRSEAVETTILREAAAYASIAAGGRKCCHR